MHKASEFCAHLAIYSREKTADVQVRKAHRHRSDYQCRGVPDSDHYLVDVSPDAALPAGWRCKAWAIQHAIM